MAIKSEAYQCPSCTDRQAGAGVSDCPFLMSSYIFAGLGMMVNIRLAYNSAPYALIRFELPENLFSVFVRRMASALELWCLPGFVIADVMDLGLKGYYYHHDYKKWTTGAPNYKPRQGGNIYKSTGDGSSITGNSLQDARQHKFNWIIIPSIIAQWLNFLTYVILFFVYRGGGDQGHLTRFYWIIAASGFVFGIYMVLVYAMEFQYLAWYMIGENSFPMVTSFMHYVGTLFFGNRRKYDSDYIIVMIDIVISLAISFAAAVIWTWAYKSESTEKHPTVAYHKKCLKELELKPGSGTGTNYTISTGFTLDDHATTPGECGYKDHVNYYGHLVPPAIMVLVGMGLVYAIYPGIAPGMIVPFYLIDKIEMVLLIATAIPPLIVAALRETKNQWSPQHNLGDASTPPYQFQGWSKNAELKGGQEDATVNTSFYHAFDILIVVKICLAGIFIYSLHYKDSNISRSIVNQPKMSTFLSILFYVS